jgi:hypothetical protein
MRLSKIATYILALIVLIGQAQAATIILSPSSITVNRGQTFNLNVSINPLGTSISGAQLNLAYNRSNLNVNSITEGKLFKQNGANSFFNGGTINNSKGAVENIFGVILGPYNISTPGIFLSVNLTAIGQSGSTGIDLSNVIIGSPDGMAVPLDIANASIIINSPPVLSTIGNKKVYKGHTLTFTLVSTDPDGNNLTYSASNLPAGATFNPVTATFQWKPTQSGIYQNVHFEVSDGLAADFENITITVSNPANVVLSPSIKNVTIGQDFTINVSIDPSGTAIAGAQLNLAFNKSILKINNILEGDLFKQGGANTLFNSGIIDNSQGTVLNIYGAIISSSNVSTQGTFIILNATAIGLSGKSGIDVSNIMVSDLEGAAVAFNSTNGILNINDPPVLSPIDNKILDEGQALSFTVIASDVNGDSLLYTASNLPSGATFNPATKTFLWTPTFTQAGNYPNVHFEVTDGTLTDSKNITIKVNNVNRPPTLTAIPANGSIFNENDTIIIHATANDLDNDSLSYIIQIDGIQVGTSPDYNWRTNYNSSGSHIINISVNDSKELVSKTITVQINNAYPRYDVNQNGVVDIGDLALIGQHFNEKVTPPYPGYDVNMDGVVNIADIVLIALHFGEGT